ncbi:unnamed protein product [Linum tenue]|uniref:SAWADEE domain-containing protein n=2 Tax=Linum tenue TaxID=586396 RepID=A0AAV0HEM9_9ROSI|nr:unnamed protein product [Linum tenue]
MSAPPLNSAGGYNLEFHAPSDDAWYSVRAIFNGKKKELTVKFENFGDGEDLVFKPDRFVTACDLEEFEARFRPVSHQLQDWECREAKKGMLVCVSHSADGLDNRFYDATIEEVIHKDHSVVNGEEVCSCAFVVVWKHGPAKHLLHRKKIESICIVQSVSELDPAVASFLEVARQEIEGGACFKAPPFSTHEFSPGERKGSQRSASGMWFMQGDDEFKVGTQEGLDVGELPLLETSDDDDPHMGGRYALLVDNLEKGISPSEIVQFIHRETSVLVEAHISSSFFYETCTKAAIVVDSKRNFHEVCNLLDSPDHLVISQTGRPLVITEKSLPLSTYRITTQTNYTQIRKWLHGSKEQEKHVLRIATPALEEYRRAKQLKDLLTEFASHQKCLFQTLSKKENEIKQHFSSAM